MRMHVIFDKHGRYSIDLTRYDISHPDPFTTVYRRKHQRGSFERSYDHIIIKITPYKIFHCNIYTEELDLNDDLPFEEIEEVIFKVGY